MKPTSGRQSFARALSQIFFGRRSRADLDIRAAVSPLFDRAWYLIQYPDVLNAGADPLEHYLRYGAKERRNPGPRFDTAYYVEKYADVLAAGINPLVHYAKYGRPEGRYPSYRDEVIATIKASGLFDEEFYCALYADIRAAGVDPAGHYVDHGASEGRRPSQIFDVHKYLEQNPDIKSASINPVIHWIRNGSKEDRPNPFPDHHDIHLRELCNPTAFENVAPSGRDGFFVSILTPTFNTDPAYVRELYFSISNQLYTAWEWVVVDDGSSRSSTISALREIADEDPRVRIIFTTNGGISAATNIALRAAAGTHVALVDHDDLLPRDALSAVAQEWGRHPDADLFYTDEAKISPSGRVYGFSLKPAWSPALLENTMYVGHLSIYRKDFATRLGGFRSAFDGTQDYDLALRACAMSPRARHVDVIGYLWRAAPGSTALSLDSKSYALARQSSALEEYARGKSAESEVKPGPTPGYWRIDYRLPAEPPLLSYVIPTAGGFRNIRGRKTDLIRNCIESLDKTAFYPNCEYVIVHDGNVERDKFEGLFCQDKIRLVEYQYDRFNLAEKINIGVSHASGEFIFLLNDDIEAITPRGAERLVSYMIANPRVGAMGTLCLYEDMTVQHNGVVLLEQGPSHYGINRSPHFSGHPFLFQCRREVIGVTGAALLTRRAIFEELGGFQRFLPFNYNDVDFCARVIEHGLTCVVDPDVQIFHFEGMMKLGNAKCEKEALTILHPGLRDKYFNRQFDQRSPYMELQLGQRDRLDVGDPISFERWLDERIALRVREMQPTGQLKLSVGMSVYDQPAWMLKEAYRSYAMQTYANKELIIIDNGSTRPETIGWLETVKAEGAATIIRHEVNMGICGANRTILDASEGEFLLFLDADDYLTIDALQVMAFYMEKHNKEKIFYSDEFKSDMSSRKFSPFFKPDFDPILLMNCCYPSHLNAMNCDFLREIGAYADDRAAWCHDYDMLTRALAAGEKPIHVPELLYAWRINPGSTASAGTSTKPGTIASQRYVLERLLRDKKKDAALTIRPNELFPHDGMWRLSALLSADDIEIVSAYSVWMAEASAVRERLHAVGATGKKWLAILPDEIDVQHACRELSAPALLDDRVAAVGGILLTGDAGCVEWSGGFMLDGGDILDPYVGVNFGESGYHGQLYCQRCVDVLPPVGLLVRSDLIAAALQRAGTFVDSDSFMVGLALEMRERGLLAAVTPHFRIDINAAGRLLSPAGRYRVLEPHAGSRPSRWYAPFLDPERPYQIKRPRSQIF